MNNGRNIDVDSDKLLDLIDQYQKINQNISDMASGCKKPGIPSFLDVENQIDGLMRKVQEAENKLEDSMIEVEDIIKNSIATLQKNDETNMLDFFSQRDLNYLLSGLTVSRDNDVPIEKRKKQLDEMISVYKDVLKELKDEYNKFYGEGIPYDAKKTYEMLMLFDALGIFIESKDESISYVSEEFNYKKATLNNDGEIFYYDVNSWLNLFHYCDEKNVSQILGNYLEGNDWQTSGMENVFGNSLKNVDIKNYGGKLGELTNNDTELMFLYRYLGLTRETHIDIIYEFKNDIIDGYKNSCGDDYDKIFHDEEEYLDLVNPLESEFNRIRSGEEEKAVNYLKQFLKGQDLFATMNDLHSKAEDCIDKYRDIVSIENSVYNLEHYSDLMLYEDDMNSEEYRQFLLENYMDKGKYWSYKDNDFPIPSDIDTFSTEEILNYVKSFEPEGTRLPNNYEYMSQGEIALYMMYKVNGDDSKANGYLVALNDSLNQRKGFARAVERINNFEGDLSDIFDASVYGYRDGNVGFLEGMIAWFGNGDRTEEDYLKMYTVSLLSNAINNTNDVAGYHIDSSNLDFQKSLDKLSGIQKALLKNSYNVMSSVGNMTIPVVASFLPGGKIISPLLLATSSGGHSYSEARQSGATVGESYLYGIASGITEATFERLLGGIIGLNGSTEVIEKGLKGFLKGLGKEAGEEFLQKYVDGALKSIILGEAYDITGLTGSALEAAWYALQSAAIMNGATSVALKIGNKIVDIDNELLNTPYGLLDLDENQLLGFNSAEKLIQNLKNKLYSNDLESFDDINKYIRKKIFLNGDIYSKDSSSDYNIKNADVLTKLLQSMVKREAISLDELPNLFNGKKIDMWSFLDYHFRKGDLTSYEMDILEQLPDYQAVYGNLVPLMKMVDNMKKDVAIGDDYLHQQSVLIELFARKEESRRSVGCFNLLCEGAEIISYIRQLHISANNQGAISLADGTKINMFGENIEFLKNSAIRVKRMYDALPRYLQASCSKINIIDENNPTLLEGKLKRNETRGLSKYDFDRIITLGKYDSSTNNTGIFLYEKDFFHGDFELIRTLAHEAAHSYDHRHGWFSVNQDVWQKAIKQDNNKVSDYGETSVKEDFAETVGFVEGYLLMATNSSQPEYFEKEFMNFAKEHPNRYNVLRNLMY